MVSDQRTCRERLRQAFLSDCHRIERSDHSLALFSNEKYSRIVYEGEGEDRDDLWTLTEGDTIHLVHALRSNQSLQTIELTSLRIFHSRYRHDILPSICNLCVDNPFLRNLVIELPELDSTTYRDLMLACAVSSSLKQLSITSTFNFSYPGVDSSTGELQDESPIRSLLRSTKQLEALTVVHKGTDWVPVGLWIDIAVGLSINDTLLCLKLQSDLDIPMLILWGLIEHSAIQSISVGNLSIEPNSDVIWEYLLKKDTLDQIEVTSKDWNTLVPLMSQGVRNNQSMKRVLFRHVGNTAVVDEGWGDFFPWWQARCLKKTLCYTGLEELTLEAAEGTRPPRSITTPLLLGLATNTSLKSVNLRHIDLRTDDSVRWSSVLQNQTTIRKLVLDDCRLTPISAASLCRGLSLTALTDISFRQSSLLEEEWITTLLCALRKSRFKVLRRLSIESTKFCGVEACRALERLLSEQGSELVELCFGCRLTSEDGLLAVSEGLYQNQSLQELDWRVQVYVQSGYGVESLLGALSCHSSIRKLVVQAPLIDPGEADLTAVSICKQSLQTFLATNEILEKFKFLDNAETSAGFHLDVAKGINRNDTLKELHLMNTDGLKGLGKLFAKCNSLESLELFVSGMNETPQDIEAELTSMLCIASLREFKSNIGIPDKIVHQALLQNQNLRSVVGRIRTGDQTDLTDLELRLNQYGRFIFQSKGPSAAKLMPQILQRMAIQRDTSCIYSVLRTNAEILSESSSRERHHRDSQACSVESHKAIPSTCGAQAQEEVLLSSESRRPFDRSFVAHALCARGWNAFYY